MSELQPEITPVPEVSELLSWSLLAESERGQPRSTDGRIVGTSFHILCLPESMSAPSGWVKLQPRSLCSGS